MARFRIPLSLRQTYKGDWPYRWECWLRRKHDLAWGGNARCKRCGAIFDKVPFNVNAFRAAEADLARAFKEVSGFDLPRAKDTDG